MSTPIPPPPRKKTAYDKSEIGSFRFFTFGLISFQLFYVVIVILTCLASLELEKGPKVHAFLLKDRNSDTLQANIDL